MTTKAIFIVGAPGSGKTNTALRFMASLRPPKFQQHADDHIPLIPWVEFNCGDITESWRFLGRFDGEGYAQGTDRMSMGVQPHFDRFLIDNEANLVIEGDRLANKKSLDSCLAYGYEVHVVELRASAGERTRRYAERGSQQTESFIKGRLTKISNLRIYMAGDHPRMHWRVFQNEAPVDGLSIQNHLESLTA